MRLIILLLLLVSFAEAQESQRRIVRLESRLYGWYALAHPAFDKTIGRQELFKVSGQDQFLKGLAGRLVLIEGVFSEGSLHLPALAAPPVSLPETSIRRVFIWESGQTKTEGGYVLSDPRGKLNGISSGLWKLDLIVTGANNTNLEVFEVLTTVPKERNIGPKAFSDLDHPAHVDLTLTQDLLDKLTGLALSQANLKMNYQAVGLELSNLLIRLPLEVDNPWSLQGTIDVDFAGRTVLAESSFVVDALPVIEDDVLKLQPDWQSIRVEGQLPFSFVLGTNQLGSYAKYLPQSVSVLPLNSITGWFRGNGLLPKLDDPHWYLGTQAPGTIRLALADTANSLPQDEKLHPGNFRLLLGRQVVDRLMKRQVEKMLSPDTPYVPQPPLEIGKALFVPILVKEIYVRKLEAAYENSVFRFRDLTIDAGWEAGPFSGLEPVLTTSGFIRPEIINDHFSWDIVLEKLTVRSDKLPGDKDKLAREFKPQIEDALGPKLARQQNLSTRMPLSTFLTGASGDLEILKLRALDNSLTLEGTLYR